MLAQYILLLKHKRFSIDGVSQGSVSVCVCVVVIEREGGEREKEREIGGTTQK